MKLVTLLLALLCASPLVAQNTAIPRTIEWDYPTNELTPDMVFRVHASTNIATPVEQWLPVAVITNMVTGTTSAPILIHLPQEYFAVSVSNVIGMSFSDVLVAQLPAPGTNLRFR